MKKLLLLLSAILCLQLSTQAQGGIQATIKPVTATQFKVTIKNAAATAVTGNFAQYNAAIRVPQTAPQPGLVINNLLPVGSVSVNLAYTQGIYTYYNIVFEAPSGTPNPVSLVQNAELDIFSASFTGGTGIAQVDLVDSWMYNDPSGATHTGTGTSPFSIFYVNIQPSGLNGDATNYTTRLYSNAQSTAATNAPGTSFVGLTNVPLPVNIMDIHAARNENTSIITWSTASEINNAGFDIERSNDGKTFTGIGSQRSLAVNGNSDAVLKYQFTDMTPAPGINHYRLKQTDKDGKIQYSKVVSLTFGTARQVKVYPNPATDQVTIEATAVQSISLFNVLGQFVQVPVHYGAGSHTIATSGLAKGSYTLRIVTENGTTQQKIVLQN